jgi:hypothetical protein
MRVQSKQIMQLLLNHGHDIIGQGGPHETAYMQLQPQIGRLIA